MTRHYKYKYGIEHQPPPPPPPPPSQGYVYAPPPRGPELSSLQHQTETEESYFIYSTDDPFVFKVPSTNPTLIVSMLDKYN